MTHRETAYAQVLLTIVYFVGYFFTLHAFIEGRVKTPPEWRDTLGALLGVLTTGIPLILAYWFQRQRQSSDPDGHTR